jgi:Flp pilus assembly protein TadG
MRALFRLVDRFRRDRRGNIAVIFALSLLPLLSAVGCAVDYSLATRMKAKMQSAADAAAVASISQNSAGFIAAAAMSSNGSVAAGVTDANNVFNGNIKPVTGYSGLNLTSTVTKTGATLTSLVQFSANVPVVFMKVLGYQTLTVTGSSSATSSLPLYIDFYMTLDVSGSMGLPSTPSEALRMQAINPDNFVQYPTGCTLACHFAPQNSACTDSGTQQYPTDNYCMGYIYSRLGQTALSTLIKKTSTPGIPKATPPSLPTAMLNGTGVLNALTGANPLITGNSSSLPYSVPAASSCPTQGSDACIQLRLDAVGVALSDLFQTASSPQYLLVPNQFRIGLYPFITSLYQTYSPLTYSYGPSSAINTAATNLATLLDTNMNSSLGSGGTHIDVALNSMNGMIINPGTGTTPTNTLPYVFLITDGAQDPQSKGVPNGGWSGSNHATVLNNPSNSYPNACATLKNRGITIAVLYIPYQPISPVNASFAGDEDDAANNNIPSIPPSLQACASNGFFYTANTPADITSALQTMFKQALAVAHITN